MTTTVQELARDLDDAQVDRLKRAFARAIEDEDDHALATFWHQLAAGLAEESDRREGVVRSLHAAFDAPACLPDVDPPGAAA